MVDKRCNQCGEKLEFNDVNYCSLICRFKANPSFVIKSIVMILSILFVFILLIWTITSTIRLDNLLFRGEVIIYLIAAAFIGFIISFIILDRTTNGNSRTTSKNQSQYFNSNENKEKQRMYIYVYINKLTTPEQQSDEWIEFFDRD